MVFYAISSGFGPRPESTGEVPRTCRMMVGRGRGTPGVAPTSSVGLGTPLWWFRASRGGRGGARTPARWRGGAGRAPLDAARGAAPALPAAAERACLPEGAATHTASHTRLLREAGAAATPSPRPREGSTRRARAGRGDGVVTRPRRRDASRERRVAPRRCPTLCYWWSSPTLYLL